MPPQGIHIHETSVNRTVMQDSAWQIHAVDQCQRDPLRECFPTGTRQRGLHMLQKERGSKVLYGPVGKQISQRNTNHNTNLKRGVQTHESAKDLRNTAARRTQLLLDTKQIECWFTGSDKIIYCVGTNFFLIELFIIRRNKSPRVTLRPIGNMIPPVPTPREATPTPNISNIDSLQDQVVESRHLWKKCH